MCGGMTRGTWEPRATPVQTATPCPASAASIAGIVSAIPDPGRAAVSRRASSQCTAGSPDSDARPSTGPAAGGRPGSGSAAAGAGVLVAAFAFGSVM
jgi:hypothetical protein